eukprot:scaffold100423_cov18-Prasinocladus_malaysianus.AAC.1
MAASTGARTKRKNQVPIMYRYRTPMLPYRTVPAPVARDDVASRSLGSNSTTPTTTSATRNG